MKKTYALYDLGCANCAAKMEKAIGKLEGVESVRVNFLTQKLSITAADELFDSILVQVKDIVRRIEPDCSIIV